MRIRMISAWKRQGLMSTLVVHIALFSVFVLVVGFFNLAIETALLDWLEDAGAVQSVSALLVFLALFVAVETAFFLMLMWRSLNGALGSASTQRAWIAFTMIGGMLIATLTSPIAFGSFSLILPGIPEIIVLVSFPFIAKAIKAQF